MTSMGKFYEYTELLAYARWNAGDGVPYGVHEFRNSTIRSAHCFAAVPDSVEPSSS